MSLGRASSGAAPKGMLKSTAYQRCDAEGLHPEPPGHDRRYRPSLGRIEELPPHQAVTPFASLFAWYEALPCVTLYRRTLVDATRGWDESFRQGMEDKDFLLECALRAPVRFVPRTIALYRRTPSSLSTQHGFLVGLRQLRRKWAARRDLELEQQAQVRFALAFDSWLSSVFTGREALAAAARLDVATALRCSYRCLARGALARVWGLRSAGSRLRARETRARGP